MHAMMKMVDLKKFYETELMFMDLIILANFSQIRQSKISLILSNFSQIHLAKS